jgi:putative DNA primase/helicase
VELLIFVLGRENVSAASLQSLTNTRFGLASIVDKLANIGDDTPATNIEDSSVFKKIASGVQMEAEQKHQPLFVFTPTARLVFTANKIPECADDTDAWFDRWIVVPCECVFRGAEDEVKRDELMARMTATDELSGFLNRAIDGLRRLEGRGGFEETETTRSMKRVMVERTESSSALFLRTCCQKGSAWSIRTKALRNAYARWCSDAGEQPARVRNWNESVRNISGVREDTNDPMGRRWKGIALNEEGARYRDLADTRDSTNS